MGGHTRPGLGLRLPCSAILALRLCHRDGDPVEPSVMAALGLNLKSDFRDSESAYPGDTEIMMTTVTKL